MTEKKLWWAYKLPHTEVIVHDWHINSAEAKRGVGVLRGALTAGPFEAESKEEAEMYFNDLISGVKQSDFPEMSYMFTVPVNKREKFFDILEQMGYVKQPAKLKSMFNLDDPKVMEKYFKAYPPEESKEDPQKEAEIHDLGFQFGIGEKEADFSNVEANSETPITGEQLPYQNVTIRPGELLTVTVMGEGFFTQWLPYPENKPEKTDNWKKYLVTVAPPKGENWKPIVREAKWTNGYYFIYGDTFLSIKMDNVIAFMPLPEPYKK